MVISSKVKPLTTSVVTCFQPEAGVRWWICCAPGPWLALDPACQPLGSGPKTSDKNLCNISLFNSLQVFLEEWFSRSHLGDCRQLLFSAVITGGRTTITANPDLIELWILPPNKYIQRGTSHCDRAAPVVSSPGCLLSPRRLWRATPITTVSSLIKGTAGRSLRDDVPLSCSGASGVSESSWLSARPVQTSCCRTASAMGMTMAVVDVLLSHMDRNTVQHMKPSTNLRREKEASPWRQLSVFTSLQIKAESHEREWVGKHAHMPGLAPATITMRKAMRLWRFHFSMEAARQMTPISSRVVSLQYSAATWTQRKS